MEQQAARWVGAGMLRTAVTLAIAAACLPPVSGVVVRAMEVAVDREPGELSPLTAVLALAALVAACTSAALFVAVDVRRGEQRRLWHDFTAGRPVEVASRRGMAVVLALGSIAPAAAFLLLRVPFGGCVVFNLFGLPWPEPLQTSVLATAAIVVVFAVIAAYLGSLQPSVTSASRAIGRYWLWMIIPGFILFFLSVYGDPAPGTCG